MPDEVLTAVLAALGCGVLAGFAPWVIARLPEPEPEAPVEGRAVPPSKTLYRVVAGSPGLGLRLAVVAGVLGAVLGYRYGFGWGLLVVLPLVPIGVGIAVVDWTTQTIPVRVMAPTYPLMIACVVVCALAIDDLHRLWGALIGWAVIGGFYFLTWLVYPPAMGYGDVRLAGVLGIVLGFLGYDPAFVGLLSGLLVGGIGGAVLTALKLVDRKNVPFGPFMLVGAFLGALVLS